MEGSVSHPACVVPALGSPFESRNAVNGTPMIALSRSKHYRGFIEQRDKALEKILDKYLDQLDVMIRMLKKRADEITSHQYAQGVAYFHSKRTLEEFKRTMAPWWTISSEQIYWLMARLRATSYTIAHMGEAEAIARAMGADSTKIKVDKSAIDKQLSRDTPSGGDLKKRVDYAIDKLKAKVEQAFQLSQVTDAKVDEALERIERAFPRSRKIVQARPVMAKLKESGPDFTQRKRFVRLGFADQETLDDAVADYTDKYIDIDRSPAAKLINMNFDDDLYEKMVEDGEKERYAWELENEMTQDFIAGVRAGENDAANENGVTDVEWVAILDDKTDDCCAWRDGLTSAEIEDKLDDEHSDDDCEATVPPAHFNCRCRSVPVTKDLPQESEVNFDDFDEWLEKKGQG